MADIEFENSGINPDNPPADENFLIMPTAICVMQLSPPAIPEFAPYIINTGRRIQIPGF
jgi:hypothetical protein